MRAISQANEARTTRVGIRDVLVFAAVFIALPFIVRRPWIGVLTWVWLSLMNPHRLSFGAAYTFPFSLIVAIATLIGIVFSGQPLRLKGGAAAWVLLAFILWTCVTTLFALNPERAVPMFERVLKVQSFTFLALLILNSRQQLTGLVWTIVLSIGFFSVKGGLFTLYTLGEYRVWGPPDSFIADNNALALAVIMTIPLGVYLFGVHRNRWVRIALVSGLLLSTVAALGTYSRGGFVAIGAMTFWLLLQGKRKLILAAIVLCTGLSLIAFMPAQWKDRMETIFDSQQDSSVRGRLDAWAMLSNLALDRPVVGGGFEPYTKEIYRRYLPTYTTALAAHSIYFQVLGEHGFVGIALFAVFWLLTWRLGSTLVRRTRNRTGQEWAFWLARMVQVSLVGYFVGGLFLNLAYWDLPYYLMVLLAVALWIVRAEDTKSTSSTLTASPGQNRLAPIA